MSRPLATGAAAAMVYMLLYAVMWFIEGDFNPTATRGGRMLLVALVLVSGVLGAAIVPEKKERR